MTETPFGVYNTKTGENKMESKLKFDTDKHIKTNGHAYYDLTLETSNTKVNIINNSNSDYIEKGYISITLADGRVMAVNQLDSYIIMPNGLKVSI